MAAPSPTRDQHALSSDLELDRLVVEIIGRVADKWTMLLIEILTERGPSRFGELARSCQGISQAFCGVWEWAEANREAITLARARHAQPQADQDT